MKAREFRMVLQRENSSLIWTIITRPAEQIGTLKDNYGKLKGWLRVIPSSSTELETWSIDVRELKPDDGFA
jgi:hypothetical protein